MTETNNCLLSTGVRHPELLQWIQDFSNESFLFLKVIHVIAATPTATHCLTTGQITEKNVQFTNTSPQMTILV